MTNRCELNLRDLGGIDDIIPKGLFLRSGKLSILRSFMADRKLIETAIENYESH